MGWNRKYDKQIAKALGLLICACLVSGCKAFSEATTKYVSLSNSSNSIVAGTDTGTITGDKSRAEIVDDEFNSNTIEELQFEPAYFTDNKSKIRYFNNQNFFSEFSSFARSASVSATIPAGTNKVSETNNFKYIEDTSINEYTYTDCTATLEMEGKYCRIYSFGTNSYLSSSIFQKVADKFDAIYEKETNLCGKNYLSYYCYSNLITPTSDNKIDIFIYDIDNDATDAFTSTTGSIVGYFAPRDFYSKTYFSDSNAREMFYVDSYWLAIYPDEVYSTLTHEFNHMLNFVNKLCKYGNTEYLDNTWYTEMLSMCTEDLLFTDLDIDDLYSPKQRINYFNNYSNYGFITEAFWSRNSSYQLIAYANCYAFGAFLMRNYGGAKLINSIATNSYIGQYSITNALKTCGYSKTFTDVFNEFAEVLINYDGSYSELCTLNKSSSVTVGDFTYDLQSINLNDYYLYSDSSYTTKMYGPYFYASDDTDFDLCPSGIIVKTLTAKDNWTIEKKIKNQNTNITYKLY